jgi:hypothetical protein
MFKTNISMKIRNTIFIYSILILLVSELSGQSIINSNLPILPLKSASSVLFGKDIVIKDQPDRDQRNVAICSAFNGWLYAIYSFNGQYEPWITILRSVDSGITWEIIREGTTVLTHNIITRTDITTTGTEIDNIKVFVGYLGYDTAYGYRSLNIGRINGITGDPEMAFHFSTYVNDFSLASDIPYPGTMCGSGSVALLYSRYSETGPDSIIFRASTDNGNTFDISRTLATTSGYFDEVALSYGYSPTLNTGRYFAAWEYQNAEASQSGSIYTSHSEPGISNPFTTPYCIDCNDASLQGKVRNPTIATQYGNSGNTVSDLSEVILFEAKNSSTNNFEMKGQYNLFSSSTNNFQSFTLNGYLENCLTPDVFYNPVEEKFTTTFFQKDQKKLPLLSNGGNLLTPDIWDVISAGYNDSINLTDPNPQARMNHLNGTSINAWIADGTNRNGVAMFDAVASTYNNTDNHNFKEDFIYFKAYPNPCKDKVMLLFSQSSTEIVSITICNISGKEVIPRITGKYSKGENKISINTGTLIPGVYFLNFQNTKSSLTEKIIVIN